MPDYPTAGPGIPAPNAAEFGFATEEDIQAEIARAKAPRPVAPQYPLGEDPAFAPLKPGEEDPMAGVGMHRAFAGRPVAVSGGDVEVTTPGGGYKLIQPGQPGYQAAIEAQAEKEWTGQGGMPAVRTGVSTTESAVDAHVRNVLGEKGLVMLNKLRQQGASDSDIRQRLGLPARTGGAAPTGGGGYGGGAPRAPALPEDLQRPYETLYPPDYISQLATAAKQGKITPEQAKAEAEKFNKWQQSPMGIGAEMAEGQRGALEQAAEQEQQRMAIQERQAEAKAEILAEQRARGEADEANAKARQEDYDTAYADREAQYEQAVQEVKSFRIDPLAGSNPVFDGAAAAFGAVASAMLKDPTFLTSTLATINKRIDNNIRAQETQLGGLKSAAKMQANRIGMLRSKFGDDQQAKEAERRLQLENVQVQLEEQAASTDSELIRTNALHLSANLDTQIQQMRQEEKMGHAVASQQIADQRSQARMNAAYQMAQARKAQARQEEQQRSGMGPWQTGKGVADLRKRYVPGFGFAATAKTRDDVQLKLNQIDSSLAAAKQLISIGESGAASLDPKKRAQAKSLAASAAVGLGVMFNLGALSEADLAITKDIIRSPAEVTSIGAIESMKQSVRTMNDERGRVLRGVHITPGEFGTVTDPKTGAPVEGARLAMPGRGPAGPQKIDELQHQAQ